MKRTLDDVKGIGSTTRSTSHFKCLFATACFSRRCGESACCVGAMKEVDCRQFVVEGRLSSDQGDLLDAV